MRKYFFALKPHPPNIFPNKKTARRVEFAQYTTYIYFNTSTELSLFPIPLPSTMQSVQTHTFN